MMSADTRLARAVQPLVDANPKASGVYALREGLDAFAARALLADAAERTLDVQYYIWHTDMSGLLLLDALRRAAARGVRVRLLIDDNNTADSDTLLAVLDAQPGIEVRLFNPFKHRRWRFLDYLTDFRRVNRRMHNKSFTADNAATIVGGRNVGDEYFGAGHGMQFVDLDVLAVGPVVNDVTLDFERYWSCAAARPAHRILPKVSAATRARVTAESDRNAGSAEAKAYAAAVDESSFVHDLLEGGLTFEWTTVTMVSDDPAKVLGRADESSLLWPRLQKLMGTPNRAFHIISPYFVPGDSGTARLIAFARAGVAVSVLTNALEATDVVAVHAGYARRRKPLIASKVALFELKRSFARGRIGRRKLRGGSSRSSLHAKSFVVDGARVFVGSFNFDPRSARLNTEMGFVIDSPAMAAVVADAFLTEIPERGYAVRLSEAGRIQWVERGEDGTRVHESEPNTSVWLRHGVTALSRLPIEWLL